MPADAPPAPPAPPAERPLDSHYRPLIKLAAPALAAMLLRGVVSDVDVVLLGRLPCPESSTAQAAILPSMIVFFMFAGSLAYLAVGTQTYVARRHAERREEDAGAVLVNALAATLVGAVLFTATAMLVVPRMMRAVLQVDAVYEASARYLAWKLPTIALLALVSVLQSFFDGLGRTHVFLSAAIPMNAVQVLLSVALIFGVDRWGIPALGIEGAGMSGLFSGILGLIILCAHLGRPKYWRTYRPLSLRRISPRLMGEITKLSIPVVGASVVTMTGYGLFVAAAAYMDKIYPAGEVRSLCPGGGGEPIHGAATSVLLSIFKIKATACMAIGIATATLVGHALGERNPEKAERIGWTGARVGAALLAAAALAEFAFSEQILAVLTESELLRAKLLTTYRLTILLSPIMPIGMVLVHALFGAGDTKFIVGAETCLHFLCLVPLAWILGVALNLGLSGLWSAMGIYVLMLAVVMAVKFSRGKWKAIKI